MRLKFSNVLFYGVMAILILAFSLSGYAQTAVPENKGQSILQTGKKPLTNLKGMSLLDPERFTMKNRYLMSFSSVGGSGSLMGMYINTMEYRFNCPLIMRLKVAYQSQTGRLFGNKDAFTGNPNLQDGRVFIPSFDLVYTPWKNTSISFHYRDYSTYNPYNGYGGSGGFSRYSRYGYSPFARW